MRTPSSDMEESGFAQQSHADVELRRKVREQAIKVWSKKHTNGNDESSTEKCDGDNDVVTAHEEERDDVFYTKNMHNKSGKRFFSNFYPFNFIADHSVILERYSNNFNISRIKLYISVNHSID